MNEVQGPPLVHRGDGNSWIPTAQRNTPSNSLSHLKIGLAVDPQDPLDIDDHSVAAQQHSETPEAKAASFCREFFESSTQLSIVLRDPNVANHPAINSQISARLTFADVELIPSRLHDSTFLSRRQYFPEAAIFRTSMLSA